MTALTGVRVVELANERIAFAGKLMADMGADVAVVEPPGGDPSRAYPPLLDDIPGDDRSLYWWHYNTSKRSVVVDLDVEPERERLLELLGAADVFIEAEAPGALAGLGLDYEQIARVNPKIIHCAVTPFGRDDPKSSLPQTDLTLMASGGPPWSCGYDDHELPPIRGPQQAYHTGSHFAVMSALTALLHRDLSGRGQFIDVSICAALNVTTEGASHQWLVAGKTVQRQTGRHASVTPTRETQQKCADGRFANTGVPPRFPEEFGKLLGWLTTLGLETELPETVFLEMGATWEGPFDLSQIGRDDTITAIFGAGRDALQLIASRVSAQEFFVGCQRAGLAVGVVNAPEEAFEDEHFKERGFQVPVYHEDIDRTIVYPGAPYRMHASPWAIRNPAPKLGQHTAEVFEDWLQ